MVHLDVGLVLVQACDARRVPEYRRRIVGDGDERAAHARGTRADADLQELAVERPHLLEDLGRGRRAGDDPPVNDRRVHWTNGQGCITHLGEAPGCFLLVG